MIKEGSRVFASKKTKKRFEEIRERLAECNENAVLCDGLEDALVGVANRFGMEPVAAYSVEKIIDIYVKDGMTTDEAVEFFDFNVIGAYVEHCPVFLDVVA